MLLLFYTLYQGSTKYKKIIIIVNIFDEYLCELVFRCMLPQSMSHQPLIFHLL